MDDALLRAEAFTKAGTDGIMIQSRKDERLLPIKDIITLIDEL